MERPVITFSFPQPGRMGTVVAEISHVNKAYGDVRGEPGPQSGHERGQNDRFVGPNGAGKSTLLKLLAGVERPAAGSVRLGFRVCAAYYAQHQAEVMESWVDSFEDHGGEVCRGGCGARQGLPVRFPLSGDDVEKKVGVLSGGEKARLALARLLLEPAGLFDWMSPRITSTWPHGMVPHRSPASSLRVDRVLSATTGGSSTQSLRKCWKLVSAGLRAIRATGSTTSGRGARDIAVFRAWVRRAISGAAHQVAEGATEFAGGATPARGRSSYQERKNWSGVTAGRKAALGAGGAAEAAGRRNEQSFARLRLSAATRCACGVFTVADDYSLCMLSGGAGQPVLAQDK